MRLFFMLVLSAALVATPNASAAESFDVRQYGAVGDGKTLDSAGIQKAIDAAHARGGGTVHVPAGTFLVGTILLKDNITLHLADGAELLGTADLSQYQNVDPFKDGLGASVGYAMIAAVDAKNVTIEGKGTLNGNGKAVAAAKGFQGEGWGFRPMLLRLVRCDNVILRDVSLRDSAAWTTNFFQCRNVSIERVFIHSRVAPHNDGFDIDSCQGVTIKDIDVESGDDALCFKATSGVVCKDITATNCRLKSNQGAIKFGTESYGGFENVTISNCQIRDTRNGGIKVLCVDGGTLQNIQISDVTMDNVRTPIFVRLGARLKTFRDGDTQKQRSALENVAIRNVKALAAAEAQIMPPSGVFITGIPGNRIEGLTLENIEIELAGGGTAEHARAVVEIKPEVYPEINRFGKTLPAYGVFARHVDGLTLRNITLKLKSPDLRPAVVLVDVANATLSRWNMPANTQSEALVRMESVQIATLHEIAPDGPADNLLKLEQTDPANIRVEK